MAIYAYELLFKFRCVFAADKKRARGSSQFSILRP